MSDTCSKINCNKKSKYNYNNLLVPLFCYKHKLNNMVNVNNINNKINIKKNIKKNNKNNNTNIK
jgi:late competence protein required for DNA uptake (superfamily II DNA/RNA helicase)